jgi:putative PIN family toxin of toxin-antitoxin system
LKKPTQKIRVFIDTSVLIAGVASVPGASAAVLDLCEPESIQMVISRQVLVEADRNFSSKLPNLIGQFRRFIQNLAPLMVDDPSAAAMERATGLVDRKDAAILAAAMEAKVDFLITLDKKHFLKPKIKGDIPIEVCTPTDFLRIFEAFWVQD